MKTLKKYSMLYQTPEKKKRRFPALYSVKVVMKIRVFGLSAGA